MRKLLKSLKFVGFSREGAGSGLGLHFGWILGPFWEHLGAQNRKKGDPETLTKNDGQKVMQDFSGNAGPGGGGPITNQLYPPGDSHRPSITPLCATRARWRIYTSII